MHFKELVLNNYKIYYGKQVIDLSIPREQKPPYKKNLILIGGLNGAGKTTILKAIYYVLYGKQGISDQEYNELFTSSINNHYFNEGGRDCSVSLSFETEQEEVQIVVTWSFDHNKRLINENRKVLVYDKQKNEKRESYMTDEEYNEFINRRIPFEVAPFFIFDGEEVKRLIERQDTSEMKNAIQRIVSLEVYKQLVTDLRKIQSNLENKLKKSVSDKEIKDLLNRITEYQEKLHLAQQKINEITPRIAELEKEKSELTIARRQKLAQNTESNVQIQKRIASYEAKLEQINRDLKKFRSSDIVKVLLSNSIKKLQKTLTEEKQYLENKLKLERQFVPYEKFFNEINWSKIVPPLSESQIEQLKTIGKPTWIKVHNIEQEELPERNIIHDISPNDRTKILRFNTTTHYDIKNLINEKLRLEKLLKEEEENLKNAPDPIDTSEDDKMISNIQKEIWDLEAKLKKYRMHIRKYKDEITNARNILTRLEDAKKDMSEISKQYTIVSNMIQAADEFVKEITDLKASRIKFEFQNILEKLIRKDQEFFDVEFDQQHYIIKIYNDKGQPVRLKDRSAGEMQIIALSFIWALTKTAGLPLPFVIDTPLGRLDSIHRNHLIKYYFNMLSDQVIILSTDTEVTSEYMDYVQRYMVRGYHLEYNQELKYTEVKEGYFDFV
ncbi:ATPase [Parageobacillus genomosp. 1]|uniref:Nuclease SbcCD subunit C n=1 Tax=Parageobacillus genomosp. 1 TaxID=1295642 RepID=A0ABC9VBP8_9BACL|nr:DNA sulfur modification protein DndD [Parageobacillus genomosp. 1]EZP75803.1 ATPase [Parageobacillus genomosp. 1]